MGGRGGDTRETGVEGEVVRLASVSWKPRRSEVLFQFVSRIVANELVTTDESDSFGYFPIGQLPEQLSPAVRHRLTEWSGHQEQTMLITNRGPSAREWLTEQAHHRASGPVFRGPS